MLLCPHVREKEALGPQLYTIQLCRLLLESLAKTKGAFIIVHKINLNMLGYNIISRGKNTISLKIFDGDLMRKVRMK